MTLFARYGDDAAEAMLKHKGIAAPLIERYRAPAATMLRNLDPRNGRRLSMLMDEGFLTRTGKADELLAVCGQYGDRAADFIWRNKGALLVGTALAAFLQDPDPFLDGTRDLASLTVAPVAQAAKEVAIEIRPPNQLDRSLADDRGDSCPADRPAGPAPGSGAGRPPGVSSDSPTTCPSRDMGRAITSAIAYPESVGHWGEGVVSWHIEAWSWSTAIACSHRWRRWPSITSGTHWQRPAFRSPAWICA